MTYYVLEFDRDVGIPALITEKDSGPDLKYQQGQPLDPNEIPEELKLESDEPREAYPDLWNAVRAPVAGPRFFGALASAGVDNVEWYPAKIHNPARVVSGYRVMNIVGRLACLGAASVVTRWRGKVARIQRLAVDESRARGLDLFRMHEYPEAILVAERLLQHLRGLSGFSLVPATGWSDASRF